MNPATDLTVIQVTSRHQPHFEWLYHSVLKETSVFQFILVSLQDWRGNVGGGPSVLVTKPKPNIWQGPHRVTKEDWWAKANALNTAFALCRTQWMLVVDDRLVLMPGWSERVKAAAQGGYAVAGSYEKRDGMEVLDGVISRQGTTIAIDPRLAEMQRMKLPAPFPMPFNCHWMYGCCYALPLEWALNVNGVDERCDGISAEDSFFCATLQNAGYSIRFDPLLKVVEDRSSAGPSMRREDKGVSPNDKSHALIDHARRIKKAEHPLWPYDLRQLRIKVLNGLPYQPFPHPPRADHRDWFDGQPIKEF